MKKRITVKERVAELVREHGSWRLAADAVGLDSAHLYKIGTRQKRPGDKALRSIGLAPETQTFERLQLAVKRSTK